MAVVVKSKRSPRPAAMSSPPTRSRKAPHRRVEPLMSWGACGRSCSVTVPALHTGLDAEDAGAEPVEAVSAPAS